MADKIRLGIFDEHKIVQEGMCALLQTVEDIEVVLKIDQKDQLVDHLKTATIHVLMINLHTFSIQLINLISQISSTFPRIKILIISFNNDENVVLRTIKSGAKGFLARDTTRNELIEAIYTLRNGHDYFSNSITVLLLNKYITKLKTDDERSDIRSLSTREIEVMKMWGNSYTNKEIADKLYLSVRTVETHKNHIMQKLSLKTSVDMVKFAIRNNIIDL
jgi:DNA-binding NarL/FixJ family response regulator